MFIAETRQKESEPVPLLPRMVASCLNWCEVRKPEAGEGVEAETVSQVGRLDNLNPVTAIRDMTGGSFVNFAAEVGDDSASFTAEDVGDDEAGGFAAAGGGNEAEVFE